MKLPINKLVNNTGQIEGLPANPRQIDKTDYERLLKSLKEDPEFLVHKPLHVYEHNGQYVVLGGNQRLRALKELGYKDVPVTIYEPETPVEVLKRRIIIDNSTFGDYDMEMLGNEWSDEPLTDWGVDLPEDWLEQEPEIEEDEAPEVSDEPPVSKLGEVYQLGRHRIMCADSTVKDNVELLMNGEKADMVFTDPPYGIEYSRHIANKKHSQEMIKNDDVANGWLVNIPKGIPTYVCTRWDVYPLIYGELVELGHIKNVIVWDKKSHGMADLKTTYAPSHEFIIYIAEKSEPLQGNRERDVWASSRDSGLHPTMKPIEIISTALNSHHAKTVLDLFLGSGSTLVACEQTDRTCYGMELDPKYVDVIRKRYHKFVTGNEEGWADATPAI